MEEKSLYGKCFRNRLILALLSLRKMSIIISDSELEKIKYNKCHGFPKQWFGSVTGIQTLISEANIRTHGSFLDLSYSICNIKVLPGLKFKKCIWWKRKRLVHNNCPKSRPPKLCYHNKFMSGKGWKSIYMVYY